MLNQLNHLNRGLVIMKSFKLTEDANRSKDEATLVGLHLSTYCNKCAGAMQISGTRSMHAEYRVVWLSTASCKSQMAT
jgi:hypothetical protein